jgi:hypothetical protein
MVSKKSLSVGMLAMALGITAISAQSQRAQAIGDFSIEASKAGWQNHASGLDPLTRSGLAKVSLHVVEQMTASAQK